VSYVVNAHQAQAQVDDTSQGLRQIALITGPDIPPHGLWAFDISYVDDQSRVYYLADASNASVDLIDIRTNRLIGQIGGFIAVDPLSKHIFIPETGRGIVVYAQT
jgi:hypothetical protein